MPKKKYSDEFKADAVELYETHTDMSYSQVAVDLGVSTARSRRGCSQARKAAGKVPTSTLITWRRPKTNWLAYESRRDC